MNIHHHDETTKVIHGDCIETMNAMPPESVDAIVTDPPYGLSNTTPAQVADTITKWAGGDRDHVPTGRGFMGKSWDAFVPPPAVWDECLRVLKPGGHMLVFAGSRTQDLMGLSIRLAGFEMRDSLAWLYGSGFPKSRNVGKSTGAVEFDGWGTALKPAFEPIVLARKPLAEKTVARNVLAHGTGAINVDACRIEGEANRPMPRAPQGGILRLDGCHTEAELRALAEAGGKTPSGRDARATLARAIADRERYESSEEKVTNTGRWPANVLLDQHTAEWVDEQSGNVKGAVSNGNKAGNGYHGNFGVVQQTPGYADSGGASRFFYSAKAPKSERPNVDGVQHPTVKPLAIMEWLLRLVTPPGGTVLDPFAGSGTTLEAARNTGHKSIGIEAEETYLPLIDQRLQRSNTSPIELEGVGE